MRMRTHENLIVNLGDQLHPMLQRMDERLREESDPALRTAKAQRVILNLREASIIGGSLVVQSPVVLGRNDQLLRNRRMKFLQGFMLTGRLHDFGFILAQEEQDVDGLTVVVNETSSAEFATPDDFDILQNPLASETLQFSQCEIPVAHAELLLPV